MSSQKCPGYNKVAFFIKPPIPGMNLTTEFQREKLLGIFHGMKKSRSTPIVEGETFCDYASLMRKIPHLYHEDNTDTILIFSPELLSVNIVEFFTIYDVLFDQCVYPVFYTYPDLQRLPKGADRLVLSNHLAAIKYASIILHQTGYCSVCATEIKKE